MTKKIALILLVCLIWTCSAQAAVYDPIFRSQVSELTVPLNQSRILIFSDRIENISLGNPKVADVLVLESRKIYVLGKSLGSTNVVVWGKGNKDYTTFKVQVTHDLDVLKKTIHQVMPEENPEVRSAEGAIILAGEVSSPVKVDAIVQLANQFVKNARDYSLAHTGGSGGGESGKVEQPPAVINLLQVGGPNQVMLEVKVAEISRSVLKHLGINLAAYDPGRPWKIGAVNGGASFPNAVDQNDTEVPLFPNDQSWSNGQDTMTGPSVDKFEPSTAGISGAGLFFSHLTGASYFNLVIDASREDGLAKILAEPTLTTLSGESASFLSGGEFPIPVWSGDSDNITVVFKEFGISVKVLPTVLDSQRINLHLDVAVSELTDAASITTGVPGASVRFSIPSLATRSASSTVELMDGQTIGIAGLISDKLRESVNKFPGLGDLPILGALFRSQDYVSDQSELVMFVTAHLARPIAPDEIRLPTDAFVDPTDAEFFLMGRLEGKSYVPEVLLEESASDRKDAAGQPDTSKGPTFGHQL